MTRIQIAWEGGDFEPILDLEISDDDMARKLIEILKRDRAHPLTEIKAIRFVKRHEQMVEI